MELVAGTARLGVAFSGGVDSAVLLALAVQALGPDGVLAVLGVSPSLAADERSSAHDVAAFIGAPVVEVATHEGENPAYRANGPDRCFFCKDELFTRISDEVVAAPSPCAATTSSEIRVNSSSLQKKHRSGPFARYAGFSPSWVATSTTGAPMNAATSCAEDGEHAVRAQGLDGEREEHGRVDAAREGDAEPGRACD